ncbi:hypothetical protein B0H63DRAFT_554728 [Podospora didyma]|uniref:Uncharacterized protein n=1 Tax=Podospora didyma TaxID=330526 RepID=A0AAE0P4H5_9PEZI|nr:hypothetical protein B0H63DRAFT_554728 [Podospora didyma]
MPPQCTYKPLNAANAEIRLLTILPGKLLAPVQCTLRIVSLNDPPNILVDAQRHDVTVSLEGVLRRLRRRRFATRSL